MFKGKIYLYKNSDGKEEKVEKEFDNRDEFNEYIEKNPELKKLENSFEMVRFPKSFTEIRDFFNDYDKKLFGDKEKKKGFFDEVSDDFEKLFEKSKRLLK